MLARWSRVELIVIDELGYVPLAEVATELLFQVIAERAEKAAVIVTTNLPFWSGLRSSLTRLCKAVLDRFTDKAHIFETGSESSSSAELCGRRRKSEPGVRFCFRSALRAKPPKWAKPSCQTHL